MGDILLILVFGSVLIAGGILFFLYYRKNWKLNFVKKLQTADAFLDTGNLEKAKKLYEFIILGIESSSEKNWKAEIIEKKVELLGKAYRGLGSVFEKEGKEELAFTNFKKAKELNIPLNSSEIILMGRHYYKLSQTDEAAVDIYIRFIKLKPLDPETQKIYDLLEKVCCINESTGAMEKITRMGYNKKICEANPIIEWSQFYLGLGYFLDGNFTEGINRFINALNLNSNRPIIYYWLGFGFLSEFDFNADKVFNTLTKFLEFSVDDEPTKVKQGEAAFELGKLTLNKFGGYDTKQDLSQNENVENLVTAIYYFQVACSKDEKNHTYLFHLARTYSLNQNSTEAINCFEKALKLTNKLKEYYYYLAREFRLINSLKNAVDNLNKALLIDSEYIIAHDLLVEIFLITKEYEKAEEHCRSAMVNGNKKVERILKLVHALYFQQKFIEIVNEINVSPSFILGNDYTREVGFYIARAYAKNGDYDISIGWYNELPKTSRNYYYLGCTLALVGRYKEAFQYFDDVISLGNEFIAKSYQQQGKILLKENKFTEAETKFLRAIEIEKDDPESFIALGILYIYSGDLIKAEVYFQNAIVKNTNYYLPRFGLGLIKELSGKHAEAIQEYEHALLDNDSPFVIKLRLGILYGEIHEHQKSYDLLKNLLISDPSNDSLLYYLGISALYCKEVKNALIYWQELFLKYPGDNNLKANINIAHYLLGVQLIEQKKYKEAIAQWEIFLIQNNTDNNFKNSLAEIYFRAGITELTNDKRDLDYAKSLIMNAIDLNGENVRYKYFYALCLLGLKNYKESDLCFNELLDKNPEDMKTLYHKGLALLNAGNKDDALKLFNVLSKKNSGERYAKYAGWIIANEKILSGQYNEAVTMLEGL